MTDVDSIAPWVDSVHVQGIIQDILDDGTKLLAAGNDLYNTPTDKNAYLRTATASARIIALLAELQSIVNYDDR